MPRIVEAAGGEEGLLRLARAWHEPARWSTARAVACFDAAMTDVGRTDDDPVRAVLHDWFSWATRTSLGRYPWSPDDVPDGLAIRPVGVGGTGGMRGGRRHLTSSD